MPAYGDWGTEVFDGAYGGFDRRACGARPWHRRDRGRRRDRHHDRDARAQDRRPGEGRRGRRRAAARADRLARRHRPDQRLRRAHPALGARTAKGGGRQVSGNDYWTLALIIGLVAALVVAVLLVLLIQSVNSIEKSVDGLLATATKVA